MVCILLLSVAGARGEVIIGTLAELQKEAEVLYANEADRRAYIKNGEWFLKEVMRMDPEKLLGEKGLKALMTRAHREHPDKLYQRMIVVRKGVKAFQKIRDFNPDETIGEKNLELLKKNAAELFPGDYEAQLIIIRQELEGRREMNSIEVPKGMKAEEFVVLRDQVLKTYESWQLRARFFRKELECQLEIQKLLRNADEGLKRHYESVMEEYPVGFVRQMRHLAAYVTARDLKKGEEPNESEIKAAFVEAAKREWSADLLTK